jgi:hypothetical protein
VGDGPEGESITLHSTWRGIVGGFAGAVILVIGGLWGVSQAGFVVVPTVLLVVGVGSFLVMALDYPTASTFDTEGVTRHTLFRRRRLPWDGRARLTRSRPGVAITVRKLEHGGLTYGRGRRRILLVDRVESPHEFDALVELLEPTPPRRTFDASDDPDAPPSAELGLSMLPRPGENVAPTWLYRRHRWRPDWATRR